MTSKRRTKEVNISKNQAQRKFLVSETRSKKFQVLVELQQKQ